MKGEIDKDFYCGGNYYNRNYGGCIKFEGECCGEQCDKYHRKFPTPSQFKEEYGEEPADNQIVCAYYHNVYGRRCFRLHTYYTWKQLLSGEDEEYFDEPLRLSYAVIVCTPFGMPDEEWRPV